MISIKAYRQHVESFVLSFFPYIELWKKTKINNVINSDAQSDEYLSVVALNCVINEVQDKIRKKLINTKSQDLRLEFTDAQGVVFYKTLLAIPLDKEKAYHVGFVTGWIQQLDTQIINNKIYEENKIAKLNAASTTSDYFAD